MSFHTWYWWAKGKTSFHWLYRFLEPSIFSRSPQISHLKFQSCVFRCQATSLFFFSPTCSCPLASSSSLGFLSFLKSLPVSGKKFKLYSSLPKISWLFRDQSPRTLMELLLRITPELQTYHQHVHYGYLPTTDLLSFYCFSDFPQLSIMAVNKFPNQKKLYN